MVNTGIKIKLFRIDELDEKARAKAIEEHREFLLSDMRLEDFISGVEEYDTPEELNRQYDKEYDYYLLNDEPIIENIEINDYYFYEDGTLAEITHYMKDNKPYKVEFKLNGVTYDITEKALENYSV